MKLLLAMLAFFGSAGAFEAALMGQLGWFALLAGLAGFGACGVVAL